MVATMNSVHDLDVAPLSEDDSVNELLGSLQDYGCLESFIAWDCYRRAARIYAAVCDLAPEKDYRVFDAFANAAARLSLTRRVSKTAGITLLREGLALVNRIPAVGECLREGIISPRQFKRLVTYTELIEDLPCAEAIDAELAEELRRRNVWSDARLLDVTVTVITRHDPTAAERRRQKAKDARSVWCRALADGIAEIGITASAEDVELAIAAVVELAARVCKHDPRTNWARRSDAAICRLRGTPFECLCEREDCDADLDGQPLTDHHARIVLHVICEESTLSGEDEGPGPNGPDQPDPDQPDSSGPDTSGAHPDCLDPDSPSTDDPDSPAPVPDEAESCDRPGFLSGYGVISGSHVRDIAARADTLVRPLNPHPGEAMPNHLPSDPYRFSTALDTFIRARDGYCVHPGCSVPAWKCDLDHVDEYNHTDPAAGGQTSACNCNAKCRYHHLLKTFGNWLDNQYIGTDGLTHTVFSTPEGFTIQGHGQTNEELFPSLRKARFRAPPPHAPPTPSATSLDSAPLPQGSRSGPQRRRTRVAEKHARRRYERKLNHEDREARLDGMPREPPF